MIYVCATDVSQRCMRYIFSTTYGGLVHCNCGLSKVEFSRNLSTEFALTQSVYILEITMYEWLLIKMLNFYG